MTQNKYYGKTGINSLKLGGNKQIGGFLTSAVASEKVLADNGQLYDSIQNAVDNSKGIVIIGPGTFNESVKISTEGITLKGSGKGTEINGGSKGPAVTVDASNCTLKDFSVRTDSSSSYQSLECKSGNSNTTLKNITSKESSGFSSFDIQSKDSIISACTIESSSSEVGFNTDASRNIFTNCRIDSHQGDGMRIQGNDHIVSNCIIRNASQHGIQHEARDMITIGCRVDNSGQNGLEFNNAVDFIAANNRISNSGGGNIGGSNDTSGTRDDNLLGSAN